MKVEEIKPLQKKISLIVKAGDTGEPREVMLRDSGEMHRVAELLVGDETASILLSLWDKNIEKIEKDRTYKIENAYTTIFKHSIRLNIGKYGSIEESAEGPARLNEENNLSEKELSNE
ncbi:MAG: single-stranded DNA-binding protein [Candidatus Diapherotrites archaeon]|uniref:Single-stranded DNA-binding protein n=1 Tax=Candidatus Iainarchaeum sp. TaxID=3101447 RepID=A0A2D6M1Z2_9ARCH|nr:single-stranded DNA-binding protein [Candidatus Diapherotrites archaeon]|tara:strand:- start:2862 stop:3215 length:354 start_codon:yes stop_codon:yes gene_type:complete